MEACLFQLPEKNAQFFLKIQEGGFPTVADDQSDLVHPFGVGGDEDSLVAVPVDGAVDAEAFDCFSVGGQTDSEPFAHFAAWRQTASVPVLRRDQVPQFPQDLHVGFVFIMMFFFHNRNLM